MKHRTESIASGARFPIHSGFVDAIAQLCICPVNVFGFKDAAPRNQHFRLRPPQLWPRASWAHLSGMCKHRRTSSRRAPRTASEWAHQSIYMMVFTNLIIYTHGFLLKMGLGFASFGTFFQNFLRFLGSFWLPFCFIVVVLGTFLFLF